MTNKKFWLAIGVILASIIASFFIFFPIGAGKETIETNSPWIGQFFADEEDNVASFLVQKGKTFAQISQAFGIDYEEMVKILKSSEDKYNLEKIVEGREISVISNKIFGDLKKLVYQINTDEILAVSKDENGDLSSERIPIPYTTELEEIGGEINSSLFLAITEAGGDERVALALAEMFAWQIDFGVDIRKGDKFNAIFEKRYLNGNYISPGNILAAKFINDGKEFKGVYFLDSEGEDGYYDMDGLSLQKIFLKSPLSYKYISSGFSYSRLNPVTRTDWGPHRAIDYAADYGTPVVTVGEGTVSNSGQNGGLGIAVFVRHNDVYTTVYAHLSRVAVRRGAKVEQGQIIGYVGATGYATGPHLHFEMRKNGARANPLVIELPPGDPVPEKDKDEFQKTIAKFSEFLNS